MAKNREKTPKNHVIDQMCCECKHSYDWHTRGADGQMIFCRCPYDAKSGYGKYCKFLYNRACDLFEPR